MPPLKLAIFQDYLPQYRVPFFGGLIDRLKSVDIECFVIAGTPTGSQAVRGDAVSSKGWLVYAEPRQIALGPQGPRIYGYGTSRLWSSSDGVIMLLRGTSIDLIAELFKKKFTQRQVGVWGHIGRSVNAPNAVDVAIERWQMRQSDHVFGYTRQCADFAVTAGVSPEQVTAVGNSVDVSALVDAYSTATSSDVAGFMDRHGLSPGKTFGFIGGMDAAKRIDFLAITLEHLWNVDRDVKVVTGGMGGHQHLLEPAAKRGQAVILGHVGAEEKALIMRVSEALLNPGRIGLVAVEALAVGIPILTTVWKFHAPEYDYLHAGRDVFESSDSVIAFADLVSSKIRFDGVLPKHLAEPFPSLDSMVENFAQGVQKMFYP